MSTESPLVAEEIPEYRSSDVVQGLLSSLPSIPTSLRKRLHDAHCHPTDHPETLSEIDLIYGGLLCAMSTRPNDQQLVESFSMSHPETVIPFYGYHPWFAHLFFIKETEHYKSILKPSPPEDVVSHLPTPLPWEECLQSLRDRLKSNPNAHVGEIGLDKSFRLPTHTNGERDASEWRDLSPYRTTPEHQMRIFVDQCELAGEYDRAVSIHGVQCHGLLFNSLQSLWKDHAKRGKKSDKRDAISLETSKPRRFPPRICIHSASLSVDILKQYLQPSVPSELYFSFSIAINARYSQKLIDLISAIPNDRILIESDWHSEGPVRRTQLHDIARIVIHVKKWSIEEGIDILERNFRRFVYGRD